MNVNEHGCEYEWPNNTNNNSNNNNNNNNNFPETGKYWVDVQRGIVSSHGERDLFSIGWQSF